MFLSRASWCCKCISLPFKLGTYRSASQNAKVKMLKISRRVSRWVRKVGSSRKVDWIKNNALTCFLLIQFVKGQWLFFTQSEPVLRFYETIFYYYWKLILKKFTLQLHLQMIVILMKSSPNPRILGQDPNPEISGQGNPEQSIASFFCVCVLDFFRTFRLVPKTGIYCGWRWHISHHIGIF